MSTPLNVQDNTIGISEEAWNDLKAGSNSIAYNNVKQIVTAAVARNGKFIIHRDHEDDTSVMRSFDRPSELKEYLDEVDKQRADLGL